MELVSRVQLGQRMVPRCRILRLERKDLGVCGLVFAVQARPPTSDGGQP